VKILDFGAYFAGPYASRLLADLGADVIKLEPAGGDQLRGMASIFRPAQAGKRSIAVNLKDPALRRVGRELACWADIVHHNMRPGAAERLGLGYEEVQALNPDAVYVYAPGWGSSGPDRNRQSFAPLMSGYVGTGFEVAGEFNPPLFPAGHEDPGTGLVGAAGMLMALLRRRRSGGGQFVEAPQLNATMAHLAHIVRRRDGQVLGAGRLDPAQLGFGACCRLYETADGWLCVVVPTDRDVAALGRAIDIDLAGDERFATAAARGRHDDALAHVVGASFATRETREWLAALGRAGVPVAEPALDQAVPFILDPENTRTGRVAECADPDLGHVREIAQLVRVSDAEVPEHRLAPRLGEHTDEILSWLGYTPEEITEVRLRGAAR
jgi:crotonobetainyl-CoA:carnitine CoA-transferase CaiB-like acyl-CoA transferase